MDTLRVYIKWIAELFDRHCRDLTKLALKVMVELCTAATAQEKDKSNDLGAKKVCSSSK